MQEVKVHQAILRVSAARAAVQHGLQVQKLREQGLTIAQQETNDKHSQIT